MTQTTLSRQLNEAPHTARWRALGPLSYSIIALLVMIAALLLWFALAKPVQVLPRIREAPAFTLLGQDGYWLSDADLRGRFVLVSFAYARCGAACAPTTDRLGELRQHLEAAGLFGSQVVFVTVSLDPEHDTPAVLREYASRLDADAASWRLLTGEPVEIKTLAGGNFRIYYERRATPAEGELVYVRDQKVALIDKEGLVRAEYSGARFETARVLRDIDLLQREAASTGVQRTVYEAAHLFLCYAN